MGAGMYKIFFKRFIDIFVSGMGLVFIFPLLLILAVLVAIRLGRPVVFSQVRPGKQGKLFKLYKFRTMTDARDDSGQLLPDDMRMTDFGRKLRNSSLDELPELFNILKGDMSLVGPRPFLVSDIVFYTDREMHRKSVLPGLTGLAQISGRNNLTWEEKFQYDFQYVDNINFWQDMRILYRTFFKVAEQSDIATDGMETAERYGAYLLRKEKISKEEYENGIQKANQILKEFDNIR